MMHFLKAKTKEKRIQLPEFQGKKNLLWIMNNISLSYMM